MHLFVIHQKSILGEIYPFQYKTRSEKSLYIQQYYCPFSFYHSPFKITRENMEKEQYKN